MAFAGAAFAADHDKIAVKAGRIIPVAGEEIIEDEVEDEVEGEDKFKGHD